MIVSVAIPVKDGERYLAGVLGAVLEQEIDAELEVLIIDSGSRDDSLAIAKERDVRLIEIDPAQFGHGRTRNLAMTEARGELVAFLTQDATPADSQWLRALIDGFALADRVGATYGPHLPRPDAPVMIARELDAFFAAMSPSGDPVVHRADDSESVTFLSNVNSCIARSCWEEIGFRDLPYAEDQAFGEDLLAGGWQKAYVPAAGVLHSHDYGEMEFARRYFDEYRGLNRVSGHVESFNLRNVAGEVRSEVGADLRYMRERDPNGRASIATTRRSVVHHLSRRAFAALGSRGDRLPGVVQTALSLEGTGSTSVAQADELPSSRYRQLNPTIGESPYRSIRNNVESGPEPLDVPLAADRLESPLHIAWVIPPFRSGSGGHMTIFNMIANLERMGHTCSIWLHDPEEIMPANPSVTRGRIVRNFRPLDAAAYHNFENWMGADVAIATGWLTAYVVSELPYCGLKAYFVQDYEPDFYAQSAHRLWAENTYRLGMPCIAASNWLAELLRTRYDANAYDFQLGVDFDHYYPRAVVRDADTIVLYARQATPRRGVDLALLALERVLELRPRTKVVLFGWNKPLDTSFPYKFLGIADHDELARLFSEATVGLSLSLTNYSLIPQEMMACGLPVVELKGFSAEAVFGSDNSVVQLADPDPVAIADSMIALLDDPDRRTQLAAAGLEFVEDHTWDAATETVLTALRQELKARLVRA